MRVLVCGGRDYDDLTAMRAALATYNPTCAVLIHGDARGADALAKRVARDLGWSEVRAYAADWKHCGHAAGPVRNQRMIDHGKPHLVLAFPGGKGTADMVRRAEKAGVTVIHPQVEVTA